MMSTTALKEGGGGEGLSDIGIGAGQSTNDNNDNDNNNKIPNWKERIDISIAKSRKVRGSNYVQISTIDYESMEPKCRTVVFRGFLKDVPFGAVEDVLGSGGGGSSEGEGNESEENNSHYDDCVMKMITDSRSNKVQELKMFHEEWDGNGNTVEMVWWFPKSSEQYRISGKLQFIGTNGPLYSYTDAVNSNDNNDSNNYLIAERKQQWGNLSDMAREQFYWENPGIPFSSSSEQSKGVPPPGGRDDDGKVLPVPDTFLLMLVYPTKIDYLRLGDNFRQVDEWNWGDAAAGGDGSGSGGGCQWKSMRVNP